MCYNRNKGNNNINNNNNNNNNNNSNNNNNKLYTKEILKEKSLNKVFPFPIEIVSVFIFNSYLSKNIQFVF